MRLLSERVRLLALAFGYTVPMLILFAPAHIPARFLPSNVAANRNMSDFILCVLCLAVVWLVQTHIPAVLPQFGSSGDTGIVAIPVGELWDATGHFSDRAVLGQGGFGVVYGTRGRMGSLSREGRCAIKRLHHAHHEAYVGRLHNEIWLLGKCRHENLLPLLGYCLDRRALCLVYPLMAGGNLDDRLCRSPEALQRLSLLDPLGMPPRGAGAPLSWRERLRILRDAARALSYLHAPVGAKGVVLHRDVKPTNILLDEHLNARLADVELATEAPELLAGRTHVSSQSLVGTAGFVDPLYANTGHFSQLTDGFALGVTALVVFTGLPALDPTGVHAMDACEPMLEDPSHAPSYADPMAGPWPETLSVGLVEVVVGLCWRRAARSRMGLPDALSHLESLADAANARPGISALAAATDGISRPAAGSGRECVVCMAAARDVRFLCGHCVCCAACTALLERCPSCRVAPIRIADRGAALAFEETFVHIASARS